MDAGSSGNYAVGGPSLCNRTAATHKNQQPGPAAAHPQAGSEPERLRRNSAAVGPGGEFQRRQRHREECSAKRYSDASAPSTHRHAGHSSQPDAHSGSHLGAQQRWRHRASQQRCQFRRVHPLARPECPNYSWREPFGDSGCADILFRGATGKCQPAQDSESSEPENANCLFQPSCPAHAAAQQIFAAPCPMKATWGQRAPGGVPSTWAYEACSSGHCCRSVYSGLDVCRRGAPDCGPGRRSG